MTDYPTAPPPLPAQLPETVARMTILDLMTNPANTTTTTTLRRKYDAALKREHAASANHDRTGSARSLAAYSRASDATNAALRAMRAEETAIAMVGASVFHDGENGVIERYCSEYQPAATLVAVRFGERVALLKPTELGAR